MQPLQRFIVDVQGHPSNAWSAELNAKVLLLSFAVLLTAGASLAEQDQLNLEDRVVLTKASPGCVKRTEFDTMVEIARRHDPVAFAHYMTRHKCPVQEAGTTGIYEDRGFEGRAMCIRRPGRPDCLWIPSAAAQKVD